MEPIEGQIVALGAGWGVLQHDDGRSEVTLSRALAGSQRSAIAVGDHVRASRFGEGWQVIEVLERRTALSRPDPHRPSREHLIIANVEVVVVVVAARRPALHPRLIDRYLLAIARGGADAVVCVNKIDLVRHARDRQALDAKLAPYRDLATIVETSADSGRGLEALRQLLHGRLAAFVGHSGVGKSSLANAMAPNLALEVGRVRHGDGKGRHTTTEARLFEVDGLRLIDTPGVRSFGIWDIQPSELGWYFPEIAAVAQDCYFPDCSHSHEPHCAVKDAVEAGEIARSRYETYLRILASLEDERR